ncbi:hypothetical protein BJX96DRAFT_65226 [Aspergillus floccosus]
MSAAEPWYITMLRDACVCFFRAWAVGNPLLFYVICLGATGIRTNNVTLLGKSTCDKFLIVAHGPALVPCLPCAVWVFLCLLWPCLGSTSLVEGRLVYVLGLWISN